MGSGASKAPSVDTSASQDKDSKKATPIHRGTVGKKGKPSPHPPLTAKKELLKDVDLKFIDDIALQVPADLLVEDFWDVVEYMIVTPDGQVVNDLFKVRAIFRWIVSYDIMNIDTDVLPPDGSPLEYFLKIQCEIGDHAHLFYTMCSLADIPCVIINGMTKSAMYELGGEVDRTSMASQWNAVYVEGEWRIVDCFWASVCVDERNSIDRVELTKKNRLKRVMEDGEGPVPFNDFYFLVDPEQLLWTHLPDEPAWQLVKSTITEKEFQERAYVREQLHILDMEIGNNCKNCILYTDGGPVNIVFTLPMSEGRFYKFAYNLSQMKMEVINGEEKPVDLLLERFVFFEHTEEQVKFISRLPVTGMFQFDIFAVDVQHSKSYKLLCTYLIQCDGKSDSILPFPDCPDLGWGVTPHAEDAGIRLRNKENPCGRITTKTGEIEFIFEVQDIPFLSSSLKNVLINEALLSKYILSRRDKEKYIVKVRLPKEGEYALKIFADDGGNKIENYIPKDIINLLLYFDGGEKINDPFPNVAGGNVGTKPYAEKFGIDVISYHNGMVKAWGGKARVEFETHSEGLVLMCDLSSSNKDAQARGKIESTHVDNHWVFDLTLPVPGDYSMNVLAAIDEDSSNVYEIQSYMITSIVSDVKRVKFAEDTKEEDDIITATIRTSEETITIPIPRVDATEKVFTRISRRDGRDGENGTRPSVAVNSDTFDITLKEDGEYVMDVWAQDKSNVLDTVARFAICRRPSIDSYTDDIDALIESLKPQAEVEEEIEENIEEQQQAEEAIDENDEEQQQNDDVDQSTVLGDDEESDRQSEIRDRENSEIKTPSHNQKDDKESNSDAEEDKINTNDNEKREESEINTVVVIHTTTKLKEESSKYKNVSTDENRNDRPKSTQEENEGRRSADSIPAENQIAAGTVTSVVVKEGTQNRDSISTKSDDNQEKESDDVFSSSDGRSLGDVDSESIFTVQESDREDSTRNDSVSVSAFGKVAAHVIAEDQVDNDNDDDYSDDEDERLTMESEAEVKPEIDEKNMDKDTKDKYRAARRRTIVRKLNRAIRNRKLKELVRIFGEYKATQPPKSDELLREARRIINQLKAKDNLINATLSKDPDILREAINRANKYNYNMALTVQILLANRLLERYIRMKKIETTVIDMNQNAVTEMKKYTQPPNGVHQTLGATFLLLGEEATVVKDWKKCHALLFKTGKQNILRRVAAFDPKDTNPTIVAAAQKILSPFRYLQIRDVSKGAAAFFTWANNMVQQAESYRNSLRKSGKTSARNIGPRSSSMAPPSGKR
uniref:Kyphoscoliosis peptidase n=1 Tax=Magallana gigas TaxID=29159 RepID=K1R698_MAGGI